MVGNYAGVSTPGSAYVLLHHVFGEVNGKLGAWGHSVGGMGAITQAMARACEDAGVEISLEAPVARVLIDGGKAAGVRLESGEEIAAPIVAANVGPALLYRQMLDTSDLPADFNKRMKSFKTGSGTFRMNVALSELPDFTVLRGKEKAEHHTAGIIIAPGMDYMDQAYDDARAHRLVEEADRRDEAADHGRRQPRARRACTSPACSASNSRPSCPMGAAGTMRARRSPI